MTIVHIDGVSGAGKTTLGNKLSKLKNVVVIDTDDIDDKNAMKLLNDSKCNWMWNDKNIGKFNKEKDALNRDVVKKIILKNKHKTIIFVGLTITPPKANKKYFIKSNVDVVYNRLGKRTLHTICKNKESINKLYNMKNKDKSFLLLLYKYKVRGPLPYPEELKKDIFYRTKKARKKKYTVMDVDDIYDEIVVLLHQDEEEKKLKRL